VSSSTRELRSVPAGQTEPVRPTRGEDSDGNGRWAAAGAVLAGLGASLCCVGPLLFVTFGVGAGLASTFEPLRPVFTGLLVVALGIGFYTVYGHRSKPQTADACCAPGDACAVPRNRTREKVILWTATVLAVLLWSFTYWSTLLV
jgi:mercuric ion transport protein